MSFHVLLQFCRNDRKSHYREGFRELLVPTVSKPCVRHGLSTHFVSVLSRQFPQTLVLIPPCPTSVIL